MKPPKKKKKRTTGLTVNFFTTHTIIECSQRLASQPLVGTNYQTQTRVEPEGRFQIKLIPLNPMAEGGQQLASQPIIGTDAQTPTYWDPDERLTDIILAFLEHLFSGNWVVFEFHGHLESAANGTHVHGGISQLTRRTTQGYQILTLAAVITTIVIMALVLMAQLWWVAAAFLGILLGAASMAMIIRARSLQRATRLMAPWVREQLDSEG